MMNTLNLDFSNENYKQQLLVDLFNSMYDVGDEILSNGYECTVIDEACLITDKAVVTLRYDNAAYHSVEALLKENIRSIEMHIPKNETKK